MRSSMMPRRKMRPPIGSRSGAHIGTCQKIIAVGIRRAMGAKATRNDSHGDSARSNGCRIRRAARRTLAAAWGARPKVAPLGRRRHTAGAGGGRPGVRTQETSHHISTNDRPRRCNRNKGLYWRGDIRGGAKKFLLSRQNTMTLGKKARGKQRDVANCRRGV